MLPVLGCWGTSVLRRCCWDGDPRQVLVWPPPCPERDTHVPAPSPPAWDGEAAWMQEPSVFCWEYLFFFSSFLFFFLFFWSNENISAGNVCD